jgi:hypothetical protein
LKKLLQKVVEDAASLVIRSLDEKSFLKTLQALIKKLVSII